MGTQSPHFVWRSWIMHGSDRRLPIIVKPEFYIVLALTVLVFPVRWVVAWVVASTFHEVCHFAALRLSGCRIFRIQIDLNGAVMETDLLSCSREFFCALAGPLGGFALLIIAKWFPRIAICGCFQTLYNLIPIFPLDGGRAVRCAVKKLIPDAKGEQIERWLENSILLIFLLLGIYATVWLDLGLIPLIFAVILVIKNKKVKITCKAQSLGVK